MKIALCQLNPTVGDVPGNTQRIVAAVRQAADQGARLAIVPEQAVIGYPGKDLLLRRSIIDANLAALERIAREAPNVAVVVGFAERSNRPRGRPLFNAAAVLIDGRVTAASRKRLLPTYDIFDESRYFEPGDAQPVFELDGRRFGLSICEDMWTAQAGLFARPIYSCDPVAELAAAGAQLMINVSASPFTAEKYAERAALIADHARRHRMPIVYVNQVGGNDELVFDGASCVFDADGRLVAQARSFEEDTLIVDLDHLESARREPVPQGVAAIHDALVLGLRDYVRKCGFGGVVLGLSGGIDSAVVAALAAAALGPQAVHGVAMPGRFSSDHSLRDARELAQTLGIRFSVIPIEPMHAAFETTLASEFAGRPPDVTEENLQARIRGTTLMALSNKFGSLLLTTGNKSELAVGYCTLYGDMCGGLAVISDVPKTLVYELARHINALAGHIDAPAQEINELARHVNALAGRPLISHSVMTKPPSAELRPDQTDQQSLPPFDTTDFVSPQNRLTYQLTNRLIARWGEASGEIRSHEVATLDILQSWNLQPRTREFSDTYLTGLTPERVDQAVTVRRSLGNGFSQVRERDLSNLVFNAGLSPVPGIAVRGTLAFDTADRQTDALNAGIELRRADFLTVEVGSTYARDRQANGLVGRLEIHATKTILLDFLTRYDVRTTSLLEQSAGLRYTSCCWEVGLKYTYRIRGPGEKAENSVQVTFDLRIPSLTVAR